MTGPELTTDSVPASTVPDAFAPHVRWNFTVMGLDIALFMAGVSFSAWNTILPLFVRHLTSSNLVLGLVPATRSLGLNLTPILVSSLVERLHRYKPYIVLWSVLERLPYLLLALASLWLGLDHPLALLLIFFVLQFIWATGSGITTPAWLHLISLMIPLGLRGRFFGLSTGLGGLVGIGGAALTAIVLQRYNFPVNFAICFSATFALTVVSYGLLLMGREPAESMPAAKPQGPGMVTYLRTLPSFLRRERNFAFFLLASMLGNIGVTIAPFLTVAASRELHVADAQIGLYSSVLFTFTTLGSVGWGWLGDHRGYRLVLVLGASAGCACMVLAAIGLARHEEAFFFAVFALLATYTSALQVSSFTMVTEFGTPAERPTFIGLSNLALTPVALFAPILGGLVADRLGYGAVFVATALALSVAFAIYLFVMRDPRSTTA